MRRRTALRALPLLAAGALTGCSFGLQSDAPVVQTYVLRAAPVKVDTPPRGAASVRLARPLPAPGLESDRIVLVQPDHRLTHFAGSRWVGPLPEVVEALAVETLRGSGAWRTVHDSRTSFPAEYSLQITIRRFDADYSSQSPTPIVRVALECMIGRRFDREVLASFSAEASEDVGENRLSAVVGAFERALNTALATVAERSAEAVKTSTAQLPP
jgi:cholesterol transport system auxiliary component